MEKNRKLISLFSEKLKRKNLLRDLGADIKTGPAESDSVSRFNWQRMTSVEGFL